MAYTKRHHWIQEEIDFVHAQSMAGTMQKMIAFNVSQKFGFECTLKMVRNVLDRNFQNRGQKFRSSSPRERWCEAQISYSDKISNIMHLVDLKRAGHSPTRTEYKITSDGSARLEAPISYPSCVGSPASMCAETV